VGWIPFGPSNLVDDDGARGGRPAVFLSGVGLSFWCDSSVFPFSTVFSFGDVGFRSDYRSQTKNRSNPCFNIR
jgi:hypothetical protein